MLKTLLGETIEPAPDEWDRRYNVDFFIRAEDKFVGLQIKPVTFYTASDYAKWRDIHVKTNALFQKRLGGEVFLISSVKVGDKKNIANPEVVPLIRAEIERLKSA